MGSSDVFNVLADTFTGGAFSANKARKQAERDTKRQRDEAAQRLSEEQAAAATEGAEATEAARLKKEKRLRKSASTVTTSPVGLTDAAPGTRKTLLGQ